MAIGTPKPFIPAVLRDRKGDLSKRWYIEFYAWDEKVNRLKRKHLIVPAKYKDARNRRVWANDKIAEINKLLNDGKYFRRTEVFEFKDARIVDLFPNLLEKRKDSLRLKSYRSLQSIYKKLEAYLLQSGNKNLLVSNFRTEHIEEWIDYMLGIGNIASTINNCTEKIGWFFEQAIGKGYLEKKKYKRRKLPETQTTKNVAFTKSHQRILEEYMLVNDYPLFLFTRFLYHAFIRPKELRNLQVKNLDFDNWCITVNGSFSKNRRNESVVMNQTLLQYAREFEDKEGYLFGKNFKLGINHQCSENYPYNRHAEALKQTGLEDLGYTLYSWKHTGAVRAYKSGVDIKKLQVLLRHSSLEITDIYLRSLNAIGEVENLAGW